jgi:hypothetical protein
MNNVNFNLLKEALSQDNFYYEKEILPIKIADLTVPNLFLPPNIDKEKPINKSSEENKEILSRINLIEIYKNKFEPKNNYVNNSTNNSGVVNDSYFKILPSALPQTKQDTIPKVVKALKDKFKNEMAKNLSSNSSTMIKNLNLYNFALYLLKVQKNSINEEDKKTVIKRITKCKKNLPYEFSDVDLYALKVILFKKIDLKEQKETNITPIQFSITNNNPIINNNNIIDDDVFSNSNVMNNNNNPMPVNSSNLALELQNQSELSNQNLRGNTRNGINKLLSGLINKSNSKSLLEYRTTAPLVNSIYKMSIELLNYQNRIEEKYEKQIKRDFSRLIRHLKNRTAYSEDYKDVNLIKLKAFFFKNIPILGEQIHSSRESSNVETIDNISLLNPQDTNAKVLKAIKYAIKKENVVLDPTPWKNYFLFALKLLNETEENISAKDKNKVICRMRSANIQGREDEFENVDLKALKKHLFAGVIFKAQTPEN